MEHDAEKHRQDLELREEINISDLRNAIKAYEDTAVISKAQATVLKKILESGDKFEIRNWRSHVYI